MSTTYLISLRASAARAMGIQTQHRAGSIRRRVTSEELVRLIRRGVRCAVLSAFELPDEPFRQGPAAPWDQRIWVARLAALGPSPWAALNDDDGQGDALIGMVDGGTALLVAPWAEFDALVSSGSFLGLEPYPRAWRIGAGLGAAVMSMPAHTRLAVVVSHVGAPPLTWPEAVASSVVGRVRQSTLFATPPQVLTLLDDPRVLQVGRSPSWQGSAPTDAGDEAEITRELASPLPQRWRGAGQILAMTDSGLDSGEVDADDGIGGRFARVTARALPARATVRAEREGWALTRPAAWDDVPPGAQGVGGGKQGHGTHVASLAVGQPDTEAHVDETHLRPPSGIVPDASLYFLAAVGEWSRGDTIESEWSGIPDDLGELFDMSAEAGAGVHTNSWNDEKQAGYDAAARAVDHAAWTHPELLIVFSVGNAGGWPPASPATAKNALTVGYLEPADGGWQKGGYSRWGRVGAREEPELWAGGHNVAGLVPRGVPADRVKDRVTYDGSSRDYRVMTGTSAAAPKVAAVAVGLRQYLNEARGLAGPSSALLRALVRNLAGPHGWITEPAAVLDGVEAVDPVLVDERVGLAEGERWVWKGRARRPDEPVAVTLVWVDPPAPETRVAAGVLQNILYLEVTTADGRTEPPSGRTPADTVQHLELSDSSGGEWTVVVNAAQVVAPGPGVGLERVQPFAVVLRNLDPVVLEAPLRLTHPSVADAADGAAVVVAEPVVAEGLAAQEDAIFVIAAGDTLGESDTRRMEAGARAIVVPAEPRGQDLVLAATLACAVGEGFVIGLLCDLSYDEHGPAFDVPPGVTSLRVLVAGADLDGEPTAQLRLDRPAADTTEAPAIRTTTRGAFASWEVESPAAGSWALTGVGTTGSWRVVVLWRGADLAPILSIVAPADGAPPRVRVEPGVLDGAPELVAWVGDVAPRAVVVGEDGVLGDSLGVARFRLVGRGVRGGVPWREESLWHVVPTGGEGG